MRISDWSSDVCSSDLVNSPDRSGRGWLDGVSHGQQPSRRAVDRNEHHRPALSATFLRGPEPVLVGDADAAHHLLIADRHTALTDVGLDALPGGGGPAAGFLVQNTARFSSGRNRCPQRTGEGTRVYVRVDQRRSVNI